jgi:hypothetical protein
VGVIAYGAGDAISLTGDTVPFGASVLAVATTTGYVVVQLSWIAGFTLDRVSVTAGGSRLACSHVLAKRPPLWRGWPKFRWVERLAFGNR